MAFSIQAKRAAIRLSSQLHESRALRRRHLLDPKKRSPPIPLNSGHFLAGLAPEIAEVRKRGGRLAGQMSSFSRKSKPTSCTQPRRKKKKPSFDQTMTRYASILYYQDF